MERMKTVISLSVILPLLLISEAFGQLVFSTNFGLFERVNGQSVRLSEPLTQGLFAGLSRNGRFITFSEPDLVSANGSNGLNPSSDLVLIDRATGTRRVIIDHDTLRIGGDLDPLSSQVSPSGQVVAYGVRIGPSFGNLDPTTALVIADVNTGVAISEPVAQRNQQLGNTGDKLSADFRGISFFPNSDSFVTPVLSLRNVPGTLVGEPVSTITRFDRGPDGQWFAAASLSTPSLTPTQFIVTTPVDWTLNYQIYPAISPNGAGLAYFDVFRPSNSGSQASSCAVILANSDGSNPRILTSFNAGFIPTGLTWTADGTALIVSVSQQFNLGTGFLSIPDTSNSAIFNVPVSGGSAIHISELGNGFGPTLPAQLPNMSVDLSSVNPQLSRSASGGLTFTASGLPASTSFDILSSSGDSLSNFTRLQSATGAELASGVSLPVTPGKRFFRLANSSQ